MKRDELVKWIKVLMPEVKDVNFKGYMGRGYVKKEDLEQLYEKLKEMELK